MGVEGGGKMGCCGGEAAILRRGLDDEVDQSLERSQLRKKRNQASRGEELKQLREAET